MKASDFFCKVYCSIGRSSFSNRPHFISLLFTAGGSTYFEISDTKRYIDNTYRNKIFSGKKPLSGPIKDSFTPLVNKDGLTVFFNEYISEHNIAKLMKSFGIQEDSSPNKAYLAQALALQFILFIKTKENEVADIVASEYKDLHIRRREWMFNIILLDDVQEQLEMLKSEIECLIEPEVRYGVKILALSKTSEVITESYNIDIDVFVLDVARNPSLTWQTKQFDYFGFDLYKQLTAENQKNFKKAKFFIWSRLPIRIMENEFDGADVVFLRKQTNSCFKVAGLIKEYLDSLYLEEHSKHNT